MNTTPSTAPSKSSSLDSAANRKDNTASSVSAPVTRITACSMKSDNNVPGSATEVNSLRVRLEAETAVTNRYRALFEEYKDKARRYKDKVNKLTFAEKQARLEAAETKLQLEQAEERASQAEDRAIRSKELQREAEERAAEAENQAMEADERAAEAEDDFANLNEDYADSINEFEARIATLERRLAKAKGRHTDAEYAAAEEREHRMKAEEAAVAAKNVADHLNDRLAESEAVTIVTNNRLEAAGSYINGVKQLFDDIGRKHGDLYEQYSAAENGSIRAPLVPEVAEGSNAGLSDADRMIFLRGLNQEVQDFIQSVHSKIRKTLNYEPEGEDEYLCPEAYFDNCDDCAITEGADAAEDGTTDMVDVPGGDAQSELGLESECSVDGSVVDGSVIDESEVNDGADVDQVQNTARDEGAQDNPGQITDRDGAEDKNEAANEYTEQEEAWLKRSEELTGLKGVFHADLIELDRAWRREPLTAEEMDNLEAHLRAIQHEGKELWMEVKHECKDILHERKERKLKQRFGSMDI